MHKKDGGFWIKIHGNLSILFKLLRTVDDLCVDRILKEICAMRRKILKKKGRVFSFLTTLAMSAMLLIGDWGGLIQAYADDAGSVVSANGTAARWNDFFQTAVLKLAYTDASDDPQSVDVDLLSLENGGQFSIPAIPRDADIAVSLQATSKDLADKFLNGQLEEGTNYRFNVPAILDYNAAVPLSLSETNPEWADLLKESGLWQGDVENLSLGFIDYHLQKSTIANPSSDSYVEITFNAGLIQALGAVKLYNEKITAINAYNEAVTGYQEAVNAYNEAIAANGDPNLLTVGGGEGSNAQTAVGIMETTAAAMEMQAGILRESKSETPAVDVAILDANSNTVLANTFLIAQNQAAFPAPSEMLETPLIQDSTSDENIILNPGENPNQNPDEILNPDTNENFDENQNPDQNTNGSFDENQNPDQNTNENFDENLDLNQNTGENQFPDQNMNENFDGNQDQTPGENFNENPIQNEGGSPEAYVMVEATRYASLQIASSNSLILLEENTIPSYTPLDANIQALPSEGDLSEITVYNIGFDFDVQAQTTVQRTEVTDEYIYDVPNTGSGELIINYVKPEFAKLGITKERVSNQDLPARTLEWKLQVVAQDENGNNIENGVLPAGVEVTDTFGDNQSFIENSLIVQGKLDKTAQAQILTLGEDYEIVSLHQDSTTPVPVALKESGLTANGDGETSDTTAGAPKNQITIRLKNPVYGPLTVTLRTQITADAVNDWLDQFNEDNKLDLTNGASTKIPVVNNADTRYEDISNQVQASGEYDMKHSAFAEKKAKAVIALDSNNEPMDVKAENVSRYIIPWTITINTQNMVRGGSKITVTENLGEQLKLSDYQGGFSYAKKDGSACDISLQELVDESNPVFILSFDKSVALIDETIVFTVYTEPTTDIKQVKNSVTIVVGDHYIEVGAESTSPGTGGYYVKKDGKLMEEGSADPYVKWKVELNKDRKAMANFTFTDQLQPIAQNGNKKHEYKHVYTGEVQITRKANGAGSSDASVTIGAFSTTTEGEVVFTAAGAPAPATTGTFTIGEQNLTWTYDPGNEATDVTGNELRMPSFKLEGENVKDYYIVEICSKPTGLPNGTIILNNKAELNGTTVIFDVTSNWKVTLSDTQFKKESRFIIDDAGERLIAWDIYLNANTLPLRNPSVRDEFGNVKTYMDFYGFAIQYTNSGTGANASWTTLFAQNVGGTATNSFTQEIKKGYFTIDESTEQVNPEDLLAKLNGMVPTSLTYHFGTDNGSATTKHYRLVYYTKLQPDKDFSEITGSNQQTGNATNLVNTAKLFENGALNMTVTTKGPDTSLDMSKNLISTGDGTISGSNVQYKPTMASLEKGFDASMTFQIAFNDKGIPFKGNAVLTDTLNLALSLPVVSSDANGWVTELGGKDGQPVVTVEMRTPGQKNGTGTLLTFSSNGGENPAAGSFTVKLEKEAGSGKQVVKIYIPADDSTGTYLQNAYTVKMTAVVDIEKLPLTDYKNDVAIQLSRVKKTVSTKTYSVTSGFAKATAWAFSSQKGTLPITKIAVADNRERPAETGWGPYKMPGVKFQLFIKENGVYRSATGGPINAYTPDKYDVYSPEEISEVIVTTDKDGFAYFSGVSLNSGKTYAVKEIGYADGYSYAGIPLNPDYIDASEAPKAAAVAWNNGNYTVKPASNGAFGSKITLDKKEIYAIQNKILPADITVLKVSADGKETPLKGARFELYKQGVAKAITGYNTQADGKALFWNLNWYCTENGTYEIREVSAPAGYSKPDSKKAVVTFTLNNGIMTINSQNNVLYHETTVVNYPGLSIRVTKKNAQDKGVGGVTIGLYKDEECTQLMGSGKTSGYYGRVTFYNDNAVPPENAGSQTTHVKLAPSNHMELGKTYYLKEIGVPDGYTSIRSEHVYPITMGTVGQNGQVTKNEICVDTVIHNGAGRIVLLKAKEDGKSPLAGATFQLFTDAEGTVPYKKGNGNYTMKTENNGMVVFTDLPVGLTYYVKEIAAPDNYYLDPTVHGPFTIAENAGDIVFSKNTTQYNAFYNGEQLKELGQDGAYVITNTPMDKKGAIEIQKTDSDENAVEGVKFELFVKNPTTKQYISTHRTATTLANGKAAFNDLAFGDYMVKEIDAPAGYYINPTEVKVTIGADKNNQEASTAKLVYTVDKDGTITVSSDNTATEKAQKSVAIEIQMTDALIPLGRIIIQKVDTEGVSITGETRQATFGLYTDPEATVPLKDSQENPRVAATDPATGIAMFTDVPVVNGLDNSNKSVYYVKEIASPEGYYLNPGIFKVEMSADAGGTVILPAADAENVEDFTKYYEYDAKGQTVTLDNTGYDKETVYHHLTVQNEEISLGRITVQKGRYDQETKQFQAIQQAGFEFTLYTNEACTEVARNATGDPLVQVTGENGQAVFNDLPRNTYYLKETKVPAGWYRNDTTVKIEVQTDVAVNTEKDIVHTVSVSNGNDGSVSVTYPTEREQAVNNSLFHQVNFANQEMEPGSIKVRKVDSTTVGSATDLIPVDGVEFTLYREYVIGENNDTTENIVGRGVTANGGWVEFKDLEQGVYYLKETKAPDKYFLNPQIVKIVIAADAENWNDLEKPYVIMPVEELADRSTEVIIDPEAQAAEKITALEYMVTFADNPYGTGDIIVVKQDESGKILPGAVFAIYKCNDDHVPETTARHEFTTNADGKVTFSGLEPGEYQIKEIKAPDGYYRNQTVVSLIISANEDEVASKTVNSFTVPVGTSEAVVDYTNDQVTMRHEATVQNEKIPLGDVKVTKRVEGSNAALQGAEFTLYTSYVNGVLGQPAASAVTNSLGEAAFENLEQGTYYLQETRAPIGYYRNTKIITIQVKADPENKTETVTEYVLDYGTSGSAQITSGEAITLHHHATVYDRQVGEGSIRIIKQDENSQPLAGARFSLFYDAACTQVVPQWSGFETDSSGNVYMNGLTAGMTYYLKETASPEGYYLNQTIVEIMVGASDSEIQSNALKTYYVPASNTSRVMYTSGMVTLQHEVTVINTPIPKGSITIRKVAENTSRPLENVRFALYHSYTGNVLSDLIATANTDEDGEILFDGLEAGTYYLRETATVNGYLLNETIVQIELVPDPVNPNSNLQPVFYNISVSTAPVLTTGTTEQSLHHWLTVENRAESSEEGGGSGGGTVIDENTPSDEEDIPDDDVPLVSPPDAVLPMNEEEEEEIFEDDVPLVGPPKTGDNSHAGAAAGVAGASLLGMVLLAFRKKKR